MNAALSFLDDVPPPRPVSPVTPVRLRLRSHRYVSDGTCCRRRCSASVGDGLSAVARCVVAVLSRQLRDDGRGDVRACRGVGLLPGSRGARRDKPSHVRAYQTRHLFTATLPPPT